MSHLNGFPQDEYTPEMIREMLEQQRLAMIIAPVVLKIYRGETELTEHELEVQRQYPDKILTALERLAAYGISKEKPKEF